MLTVDDNRIVVDGGDNMYVGLYGVNGLVND